MPPRREFTPEDALARVEQKRAWDREASRRYRARRKAVSLTHQSDDPALSLTRGSDAPPANGVVTHTPPHPPLSPLSLEREIRTALEPLTARGYVHDPRFWVLASEQYPALRLELEALKLVDWLLEPRNAKRRCSKAFLDNWLKKAEADRKQADWSAKEAAHQNGNGVASPRGIVANGTYHPPASLQHNRQPDAPRRLNGDLAPIDKDDFQRTLAAGRGVPLEQKLARLKGPVPKGGKA